MVSRDGAGRTHPQSALAASRPSLRQLRSPVVDEQLIGDQIRHLGRQRLKRCAEDGRQAQQWGVDMAIRLV